MKKSRVKNGISTGIALAACLTLAIVITIAFPAHSAQNGQKTFSSPDDAVAALIKALKDNSMKELNAIFGPEGKKILYSGDPVADKAARERFTSAFEEKNTVIRQNDTKAILQLGKDDYPFPVPIVQRKGKWLFDTRAGKDEILNRVIGRNELDTIETCLAYVYAQREYAYKDHGSGGFHEYAQKFVSSPGKHDGLYWEAKEAEEQSPLGNLFARAAAKGYKLNKPIPYHGYYFRILTFQGKNADGGAFDYIVDGKMIGGFALVAYPAKYGTSGVMTFIVNHEGIVYQKDLGPNTPKIAQSMKQFDPDPSWTKTR